MEDRPSVPGMSLESSNLIPSVLSTKYITGSETKMQYPILGKVEIEKPTCFLGNEKTYLFPWRLKLKMKMRRNYGDPPQGLVTRSGKV